MGNVCGKPSGSPGAPAWSGSSSQTGRAPTLHNSPPVPPRGTWPQPLSPSSAASSSQVSTALTDEQLIQEWDNWAANATEGEKRADALEKLKTCLNNRSQNLDLDRLWLTSLPAHLPPHLTRLYVGYNRLIVLPELPSCLTELAVNDNQLTALPGSLPAVLTQLDVKNNQLTALPKLPPHLTGLCVGYNRLIVLPELPSCLTLLSVEGNQLSALPGNLPETLIELYITRNLLTTLPDSLPGGLSQLSVEGNRLTALPNSILNLNVGCNVFVQDNQFPLSVIVSLQNTVNAQGYQGPRIYFSMGRQSQTEVRPLPQAVVDWFTDDSAANQQAWAGFENEADASVFSVFLDRLKGTIVYTKPELKTKAAQWLNTLAENSDLRELSFAVAQTASTTCDDRVLLSYNSMQKAMLQHAAEKGEYDNNLPGLIGLARGMFRLDELETIAREKAKTLRFVDEIEVYLAYETKLAKKLNLPMDVDEMLFYGVSGVTARDLFDTAITVAKLEAEHFLPFLVNWDPWDKMLERLEGDAYEKAKTDLALTLPDEAEQMVKAIEAELRGALRAGERLKAGADIGQQLMLEMKIAFTQKFLEKRNLTEHLPQAAPRTVNPPSST